MKGTRCFPSATSTPPSKRSKPQRPELVITDLYLDKTRTHGLEILQKARALNPPSTVIVITAYATIETAVDAMKKGAFDYLEKPFKVEDLRLCIQRALSYNDAISENVYLRKQLKKKYQFNQLIGNSPQMQDVFKMIERVADTDSTILILGESGTGKELVARPCILTAAGNCAVHPHQLQRPARKLARIRIVRPLQRAPSPAPSTTKRACSRKPTAARFSSMKSAPCPRSCKAASCAFCRKRKSGASATTSRSASMSASWPRPTSRWKNGSRKATFREDLYYRLNVIPINLRSLRERRDDMPVLTMHFLRNKVNSRTGKLFQITRKALEVLTAHDWPGNVRELENAIERGCALCEDGIIRVADLPPPSIAMPPAKARRNWCETPQTDAAPAGAHAPWRPQRRLCARRPEPSGRHAQGFSARTGVDLRQPRPCPNGRRQGKSRRTARRQRGHHLPQTGRGGDGRRRSATR